LTWFKRTENAQWFDYLTDRAKIIQHIETFIIPNS
jgi:tRNA dimethylallyltransferase